MSAAKLLWLVFLHGPWTCASVAWCALFRRRGVLVLTHAADVDSNGVDIQMGALVEALEKRPEPVVHVALIPLNDSGLISQANRVRGPFLSVGALFAAARVLEAFLGDRREARVRIASWVLRLCAPRACFLIDESGSGQMWVAAARSVGVRSIGVQHGDFTSDNRQYAPAFGAPFAVEPVDAFCVWSSWFQERLLAVSPIYTEANTKVVGRMCHVDGEVVGARRRKKPRASAEGPLRALVIAEAHPSFEAAVEPYLGAMRASDDIEFLVRKHPSDPTDRWSPADSTEGPLYRLLEDADLVLGLGSSALLEAVWAERPVILLGSDPAGYAAQGIATLCPHSARLVDLCRRAASGKNLQARERVWGSVLPDTLSLMMDQAGLH